MDHPTNLMIINGVLLFDRPLDVDRLKTVLEERFLIIPRFRQRLVFGPTSGKAHWETDPAFDLSAHLLRTELPEPGDDEALRQVVGTLMSQPLDAEKPLWRFYILDNYQGGSAVLTRLHHCIADGLALMMVLLSLTDLGPRRGPLTGGAGAGEGGPRQPGDAGEDAGGDAEENAEEDGSNPLASLFHHASHAPEKAKEMVARLMPEGLKILSKPAEMLRSLGAWKKGAGSALALGRLTFLMNDPKTALKGPLGVDKRVAWSKALPMDEVQTVRAGLGGTVNDVLVTAMAGGLRRYLESRGESPDGRDFRAMVPVSLRPVEEMAHMGNRFGLVLLSLPVSLAHPVERLEELRRRMRSLTRSLEPWVAYKILSAMGLFPRGVQKLVMRFFTAKATAVMTNVPGPRETLYLAGEPIRGLMFWVPHAGSLALGISILSYAGEVRLGVDADAGLVPDPQGIIDGFHEELARMLELARESGRGAPG
jgi:WS/DGAT/MGAT family acyltransferase